VTSFDYLVLTVLGLSAGLGLFRGLIKEVLSLLAYAVAFIAAIWWAPRLSSWTITLIQNDLLRTALAYALVFIIVLLLMGLLNVTLAAAISRTGLGPADHGLGALFGFLRGLLLVLVLVTLAGYTELPEEPWWQEARLSGAAVRAVQTIKHLMPETAASWLPY